MERRDSDEYRKAAIASTVTEHYLIAAGLVTVDRKKGRSPRVSIVTRSKSRRRANG